MASKKEMDKCLTSLQQMQRKCFTKGSSVSLDVHPSICNDGDFAILVTAYNAEKRYMYENSEGEMESYDFECYQLYSFWSNERNSQIVRQVAEYLDLDSDGQR